MGDIDVVGQENFGTVLGSSVWPLTWQPVDMGHAQ